MPQLIGAANTEFHEPLGRIQIQIPSNVPQETLKTLAFELDNIDISEMMVMQGSFLFFTPVQPLSWGKHVLRLVEYAEDGSIFERGFWEIQVRESTIFQKIDHSVEGNLLVSQRLFDKNIGVPKPRALSARGSVTLNSRASNEDWIITGNTDLIANSERSQTMHDRALDIGEYLVTARSETSQLNLGHHSIGQNNLLLDSFYRRGFSASTGIDAANSTATAFVMRSEEVIGVEDGLGLSDPGNLISGASWESQLQLEDSEQLYLSATYLSGNRNKFSESVGATQSDQKGDAWSLVADTTLNSQQLRLRFEYAESVNDIITADLNDVDIIDGEGKAHSFLATYSPLAESENQTFFWNTGIESREVSTLFSSIANSNLPSDKSLIRLFFNANWSEVSAQFLSANETDNVDRDNNRAQFETDLKQLALTYSAMEKPAQGSLFDTLGRPTFSLQRSEIDQGRIKDALVPTEDLQIATDTSALSANFIKEKWNWGWSYSRSNEENKINPAVNTTTLVHDLNASARINSQLELESAAQFLNTRFAADGSNADTVFFGLGINYAFSKSVSGQFNLSQSSTNSESIFNLQDSEEVTTDFQVAWNWILAKNNKPGFDVSLSGIYQDTQDHLVTGNNLETYQVFINLIMTLPQNSGG